MDSRLTKDMETAGYDVLNPLPEEAAPPPRKMRLSPINQRRLANFKANKRGFWSFWIFMFLFLASLLAEFIANDRPTRIEGPGQRDDGINKSALFRPRGLMPNPPGFVEWHPGDHAGMGPVPFDEVHPFPRQRFDQFRRVDLS